MIKPLTSLRFFFAFFVFLSHISFVKTDNSVFNWFQRNVFFEGYLGVSFFFILSGFVLAYSYKDKFSQRLLSKKKFYLARVARIYPLHLLTLIISVPITVYDDDFGWAKLCFNILLLQSFIPIESFYSGFNSPSWSISNEMFFYLLFPFSITLASLNKIKIYWITLSLMAIVITTISYISVESWKVLVYYNPFMRFFDFLIGILLFGIYKQYINKNNSPSKKVASLVEILAITFFFVFFILHNYIPRGFRFSVYYWIPMSVIIFTFALQKGVISKLLCNKWLVLLGEISFGFYMIHYLVIKYGLLMKKFYFDNFNDIIFAIILFFATLGLSLVSFYYFEKPMNTFIKKKLIKL
ncbi:Acyltransferase family protein [compost metagenome]